MTPAQLEAFVANAVQRALPGLAPVDRIRPDVDRDVTPDNKIADGSGSSDPEEPMYRWISAKPYRHHERWRVWFKTLDGERAYRNHLGKAGVSRPNRAFSLSGAPAVDAKR